MTNPVDPETGAVLHRSVRPLILTYKGNSITVDMPASTPTKAFTQAPT